MSSSLTPGIVGIDRVTGTAEGPEGPSAVVIMSRLCRSVLVRLGLGDTGAPLMHASLKVVKQGGNALGVGLPHLSARLLVWSTASIDLRELSDHLLALVHRPKPGCPNDGLLYRYATLYRRK